MYRRVAQCGSILSSRYVQSDAPGKTKRPQRLKYKSLRGENNVSAFAEYSSFTNSGAIRD